MLRKLINRLLPLTLSALLIISLTACTVLPDPNGSKKPTKVTIDDLMQKQENQNGAAQMIEKMDAIRGVPSAISGKLLLTHETVLEDSRSMPIYRIYNLELGKQLVSVSDNRSIGFVSKFLQNPKNADGSYYIINENVMYIFNSDGTQAIASYYSEDGSYPIADTLNGFSFNGTEYYVRDGLVVYEGDNPLESAYFNASEEYLGRHYYLEENEAVFVFDNLGKPIYEFHSVYLRDHRRGRVRLHP